MAIDDNNYVDPADQVGGMTGGKGQTDLGGMETAVEASVPAKPAPVQGDVVDDSQTIDWDTPKERGFNWGAAAIGAALGGLSTVTGNKQYLSQFAQNQAKAAAAYNDRMGRLREIQAEADGNARLAEHLRMIGGGDINKGARKWSHKSSAAIQQDARRWAQADTALGLAKNLLDAEAITQAQYDRYEAMGADLSLELLRTENEFEARKKSQEVEAERLKIQKGTSTLNRFSQVLSYLLKDFEPDEAMDKLTEITGFDLRRIAEGSKGYIDEHTGVNTGDADDVEATPGGKEVADAVDSTAKRMMLMIEDNERKSSSAQFMDVQTSSSNPYEYYDKLNTYMVKGLASEGQPWSTSATRRKAATASMQGSEMNQNLRAGILEVTQLMQALEGYGEGGQPITNETLKTLRDEGSLAHRALFEGLSPEQISFLMDHGMQVAKSGASVMGDLEFIKYMQGDGNSHNIIGASKDDDTNSLYSLFGKENSKERAERGKLGMHYTNLRDKVSSAYTRSLQALGIDDMLGPGVDFNIASLSQKDLDTMAQGDFPDPLMDLAADHFIASVNNPQLSDDTGIDKPSEMRAIADRFRHSDFKAMPDEFKSAIRKRVYNAENRQERVDRIRGANPAMEAQTAQNNVLELGRNARDAMADKSVGINVNQIHDSRGLFETNESQWSHKYLNAFFDLLHDSRMSLPEEIVSEHFNKSQYIQRPGMTSTSQLSREGYDPGSQSRMGSWSPSVTDDQMLAAGGSNVRTAPKGSSFDQTPIRMLVEMRSLLNDPIEITVQNRHPDNLAYMEDDSDLQRTAITNVADFIIGEAERSEDMSLVTSDKVAVLKSLNSSHQAKFLRDPLIQKAQLLDPQVFNQDTGEIRVMRGDQTPLELAEQAAQAQISLSQFPKVFVTQGGTQTYGVALVKQYEEDREMAKAELDVLNAIGGPGAKPLIDQLNDEIAGYDDLLGTESKPGSIYTADRQVSRLNDVIETMGDSFMMGMPKANAATPITDPGVLVVGKDSNASDIASVFAGAGAAASTQNIFSMSGAYETGYADSPYSIKNEARSLDNVLISAIGAQQPGQQQGEMVSGLAVEGRIRQDLGIKFYEEVDALHKIRMEKSIDDLILEYNAVAGPGKHLLGAEVKKIKEEKENEQEYKYNLSRAIMGLSRRRQPNEK